MEDLFPITDYINAFNEVYGKKIEVSEIDENKMITDVLKEMNNGELDKKKITKKLLDNIEQNPDKILVVFEPIFKDLKSLTDKFKINQ